MNFSRIRYRRPKDGKEVSLAFVLLFFIYIVTTLVAFFWLFSRPKQEELQVKEAIVQEKKTEVKKVVIFIPDLKNPPWLEKQEYEILQESDSLKTMIEQVIEKISVVNPEFSVPMALREIYDYDGGLVLDLSKPCQEWFFKTPLRSIQNLYSIVNSILYNSGREKIQILFGGEQVYAEGKRMPVDLSSPLEMNLYLAQRK